MEAIVIFYPACAMAFLTLSLLASLGIRRNIAVNTKQVDISVFSTFTEQQPEKLQILSRHIQNLFEAPVLFYIVIFFAFVTHNVSNVNVALAWGYFVARCLHSFIHLGSNNVKHRFIVFVISMILLTSLWIHLFIRILQTAGN